MPSPSSIGPVPRAGERQTWSAAWRWPALKSSKFFRKCLDKSTEIWYNVLMTNDDSKTSYRIRFTCHSSQAVKDIVREDILPADPESGLSAHMFWLSGAEPGAVITYVQGTYVRTWTLLEILP